MNLLSIVFVIHLLPVQEPKVNKVGDLDQVEIFNSVDDFKQYHSNSFRVNLFRGRDLGQKETVRYPLVNYYIGVLNYSESNPDLYKVGTFYNPEITQGTRLKDAIRITIEHGRYTNRLRTIMLIKKEGVELK